MQGTPHGKALSLVAAAAFLVTAAGCGGGGGNGQPVNALEPTASARWSTLGTRLTASTANRVPATVASGWTDYDPPVLYPGTAAESDIQIPMDDGVIITLNVVHPAEADGTAVLAPLPTIVTFTPYNKNVGDTIPLGGGINDYFVTHGYHHVLVDVRGTGRSGGGWDPFGVREQADYPQVLDWVTTQPWSNGVIGMWGISATATTSMLAAASGHPAIKAVFPIVPHGDIYRDVVFVGGQASVAFLPAWMAVVTFLATLDPHFYVQPDQYFMAVSEHLAGANGFLLSRTVGVLAQSPDTAYDNEYWATKAPLEVAHNLQVPTFIVGGLFDIFQRSEPLNYEALKNHTTAKLLIGPWHHLQAAGGEGLPLDGVPVLDHIALMWFDRYLKDIPNGAGELPAVTQWVWGHEHFDTSADWPHPQARALRLFLQPAGGLDAAAPPAGAAPSRVIQQPFNGICSESSMQISLGLVAYAPLPCWYEDNLVQQTEAVFETAPLAEDLYVNGPMVANIWMSTTARDAGLVVRVSDLGPDGTARSLTSGLQTVSLRAVDSQRSRTLDGLLIQPWHPFSAQSVQLPQGIVEVPVEIFPTSALIAKGHALRISVGASNFPFATMPIPTLGQSLAGLMSIYTDAGHPSSVVLPIVPASELRN